MLLTLGDIENAHALLGVQPIDFVPNLKQPLIVRFNAELGENRFYVVRLCFRVFVGNIAHVQDDVRLDHFFKRGTEGCHEHGRQIRDESDRIGKDGARTMRQFDGAQRRIQRRKQHVR